MTKILILKDKLDQLISVRIAQSFIETGENMTVADLSAEFGAYADVSPTALVQIKSSNYMPSLATAFKLAKFFGVPLEEIFQLEDDDVDQANS